MLDWIFCMTNRGKNKKLSSKTNTFHFSLQNINESLFNVLRVLLALDVMNRKRYPMKALRFCMWQYKIKFLLDIARHSSRPVRNRGIRVIRDTTLLICRPKDLLTESFVPIRNWWNHGIYDRCWYDCIWKTRVGTRSFGSHRN